MKLLTKCASLAILVVALTGPSLAMPAYAVLATTTGTVESITYGANGQAESFGVDTNDDGTVDETFEIATPGDRMTENLQGWKSNDTTIIVDDINGDDIINGADTITEV